MAKQTPTTTDAAAFDDASAEQPQRPNPPSPGQIPTVGRIVHYRLRSDQAAEINARRKAGQTASFHPVDARGAATGSQIHIGNSVEEDDVYPMMITRVWGNTPGAAVNGQVMLDGNDLHWATSVCVGEGPGTWSWPVK